MPFDPKILRPDEPEFADTPEFDLPDDLAALGEQLRDDARHLAERYPAGDAGRAAGATAVQNASVQGGHAARYVVWSVTTGLAAAAVAAVLAVVVNGVWRTGPDPAPVTTAQDDAAMKDSAARKNASSTPAPREPASAGSEEDQAGTNASRVARGGSRAGGEQTPSTGEDESPGGSQQAAPVGVFFHDVSSPEIEGMLDLLDEDEQQAARLSI